MINKAFLLLLVFTIPVIYQSGHVLLHHSHDEFYCCITDETKASHYFVDAGQNQHCVIAEYTFTHQDLPEDQAITYNSPCLENIQNFYTHPGYKNLKTNKKSSRAPPFA